MTEDVFTLSPVQSLPLAASLMHLKRVRHIPVVDGGHLVGLVTHRDLLAASISTLSPLSDEERSTLQLAIPVSRVMRAPVWTVQSSTLALKAARLMRDHSIGCLPVVDDGKLVGIVTEADMLDVVTDALELRKPNEPWTVERAMTPAPTLVEASATLAEVRRLMDEHRVRHLPVVHGKQPKQPVGLISDRDLRVAEVVYGELRNHTRLLRALQLVAHEAPRAVSPRTRVDSVLAEMAKYRVDAVLVVDEGELVGILTAVDACRILSEQLPHGEG